MILVDRAQIVDTNLTNRPTESTVLRKDSKPLVLPAHSICFVEEGHTDKDGFPLYEFVHTDYARIAGEGTIVSIVSTEKLDAEVGLAEKAEPSASLKQKSYKTYHGVHFARDRKKGLPYKADPEYFRDICESRKNIGQYGIAPHDEDVYLQEDVDADVNRLRHEWDRLGLDSGLDEYIAERQWIFLGNPKPWHLHTVVHGAAKGKTGDYQSITVSSMSTMFSEVPITNWAFLEDNSKKFKGRGNDGLLDQMLYLVHDKENWLSMGKKLYDDERVISNFDWRGALEEREQVNARYGIDNPSTLERWEYDLLEGATNLNACYEEDRYLYGNNIEKLEKWRNDYVLRRCPLPAIRQNFYIEADSAQGGEGKSIATHALAKCLAARYGADISQPYYNLNDFIFNVNDSRVALQHYDGQPIVVLNEMKAGDMMVSFNGRRGVKNLLEPFPEEKIAYHVKFGDVSVVAKYFIINGIQSCEEFKDELAKAKDQNDNTTEERAMIQFNRRIWGGLKIMNDHEIAVMFQEKLLDPTVEKYRYMELCRIRVNFAAIRRKYEGKPLVMVEEKIIDPLIEKIDVSADIHVGHKISDPDLIDPADLEIEVIETAKLEKVPGEIIEEAKQKGYEEELKRISQEEYEAALRQAEIEGAEQARADKNQLKQKAEAEKRSKKIEKYLAKVEKIYNEAGPQKMINFLKIVVTNEVYEKDLQSDRRYSYKNAYNGISDLIDWSWIASEIKLDTSYDGFFQALERDSQWYYDFDPHLKRLPFDKVIAARRLVLQCLHEMGYDPKTDRITIYDSEFVQNKKPAIPAGTE